MSRSTPARAKASRAAARSASSSELPDDTPAGGVDDRADKPRTGRPRDAALDGAILRAARRHLVSRGYSSMTMAEVAVEAGVSRPTVYRRWSKKFDLVSDALDYGLQAQERLYVKAGDPTDLPPRDAVMEAVRRVDPCWANPDAIVLQGNIIGETNRAPELLDLAAARAVNPRVGRLEEVLTRLQASGDVRADADIHTVATMCFGAFFGAHLRGETEHEVLADEVGRTLWQLVGVHKPARPRRAARKTGGSTGRRRPG